MAQVGGGGDGKPVIITAGGAPGVLAGAGAARPGTGKIDRYAAALGLDEAQTQAARALYEAYARSTAEARQRMRDALKDSREKIADGDHAAFDAKLQSVMSEMHESTSKLDKSFNDDLKAILRPDQEGNWANLERLRRRDSFLRMGSMGGSTVDLVRVVDGLNLPAPERAKVAESLGLYEVDMDRVLKDRQEQQEQEAKAQAAQNPDQPKGAVMIRFDSSNDEEFKKMREREREADMRVREVNQRYARIMGEQLDDPWKGRLSEMFRQQSYKQIYKPSSVARKLAAAQKVDGLTPAQKERLKSMAADYKAKAKAANDRWAGAMSKAEDAGTAQGGRLGMLAGMGDPANEDPALKEARVARRDLDRATRDELDKMLSDQQREQLADLDKPAREGLGGGGNMQVFAVGHGDEDGMVFVSDEMEELGEDDGPGGGGVMIMRTVEVVAPGAPVTTPPATAPKKDK